MAKKVVKTYDTVHVVGGCGTTEAFFKEIGFKIAKSTNESFDICVFSGGAADVHPFLYGQAKLKETHVSPDRDLHEVKVWKSLPNSMPKIGICRGAQLGNVMCGGTLWQDVDNHKNGIHKARVQNKSGNEQYVDIMTLHHQMCRPTEEAEILVKANSSTIKKDDSEVRNIIPGSWNDIEAFYYEHQNFLGVQWHPEYNHKASTELFNELFYQYCFNR